MDIDQNVETRLKRWLQRSATWWRLKKLKREVRASERFQSECKRLRCFALAQLEEEYRVRLTEKIETLADNGLPKSVD